MTAQRAPEALVVGLLTDDGFPRQLAGRIAEGLPDRLARDLGEETTWHIEHETQALPLNEEGDIPMLDLAQQRRAEHGWDLLVLITDLPRRAGTVPIASDYNADHGVAMVSLPALGALRLRGRVSRLIVHLVRHLVARRSAKEADPPQGILDRLRELVAPTRHIRGHGGRGGHRRVRHHHHVVLEARRSPARVAAGRDHGPGDRGHVGLADGAQPPLGFAVRAPLFALSLLASIVLIEGTYFGQVLGHPAKTKNASAARPTAGASGSGSSATASAPRKPKAAMTTERSPVAKVAARWPPLRASR
ncbi:hypothetical protein ACFVYA_07180 [Amycolatopsis sp. NPDC058278]|uniref:hypothetical protein n=1 Tax=Amycolatopsis sp. NPDC058278 TaxID=3346417 RepID=UPI0036DCF4E3